VVDKALSVLIIEDSLNDVEMLSNIIRNAGHAVRPASAEDEEELHQVIDIMPLDMALCAIDSPEPTLNQVCQAIHRKNPAVPVVATCESVTGELQNTAMEAGAVDLVGKDNHQHMERVLEREIANLRVRQKLANIGSSTKELERQCHSLLNSSRDAIAYVHEGMHIFANPVYLNMFSFDSPEDVEGMPVLDMIAPDDHDIFKKFLREYSKGADKHQELKVRALLPDGKTFNATMEFSPASIDGEPCTQIIIRDRISNEELEEKIDYLSKQDLLTGLFNRQYFLEELEVMMHHEQQADITRAVLYVEPDNYNDVKAKVGLAGTDLVLNDMANLIRGNISGNDMAARFSDHVFTVLTSRSNLKEIEQLATDICRAVENHISDIDGESLTITCSIGISFINPATEDSQQLLSNADVACNMARKDDGNRFHIHNPLTDGDATKERDQYWVHLIRDTLDNNRFDLIYQPIASLHGDTTEKYEILLRMKDEEGDEILPGQFLPAAIKNNLMNTIDRWVIDHAFEILAERRQNGHDTTFFIKLSGITLVDETLLPWISQQLKKYRLQGNAVVFQLSEEDTTKYLKNAKQFCHNLGELHAGFCIEHFGSSQHPFQVLQHLKVTYLKIDGKLMHNLASNQENQEKLQILTEKAEKLGIPTIAEFVEDANSLAVLWQSGIQYIQGHFLQKPEADMTFNFDEDS
jgi:diguanylate cyclase (GGDEF)-like protein/PAS domain S-box-containing protein